MFEKRRLHPAAVLLNMGAYIWNLGPLSMFAVFRFRNSLPFSPFWNSLLLALLFLVLLFTFAFIRWRRFTYMVEPDQICIESGIWLRNKRYIPKERMQSIHELQDIVHRLFGLVKLQIETASGGNDHEGVLTAITREEAVWIQRVFSHGQAASEEEQLSSYELSKRRLLLYAATSGSVGLVLSAAVGLYSELDDYFDIPDALAFFYEKTAGFYAIGILVLGLLAWAVGMLLVYQKYYGFRLVRQRDELVMTRGLFEKKKVVIPLKRIQAVKIEENMVRQWLGFATVHLLSAGSQEDEHEKFSYICLPLVPKRELPGLLRVFLPGYVPQTSFVRLPRRAQRRYMIRAALPLAVAGFTAFYFFPVMKYVLPPVLAGAMLFGFWQYWDAGWSLEGQQVILSRRRLNRVTVLVQRKHIQSLAVSRTVWQDYASLCTVRLHVKSGALSASFAVKDSDESLGVLLRAWYSSQKVRNVS
ncbi:PH domain-containing protein [Ectobacillus ponti]|uniref:PH domain-containing protein n=1 Tax=Ectobacillus ponti TaxID=2961894 RepID=A0AA41X8B4_9BACI|nr:PH domain-containing protein [Ectobacillus ponti]MCP8968153.1 PH domain-containing protein [Ectobacillus ponti]